MRIIKIEKFHVAGLIPYVVPFSPWLDAFDIQSCKHVSIFYSFLLLSNFPLHEYGVYIVTWFLKMHSPVDKHLGSFPFGIIMNKASTNNKKLCTRVSFLLDKFQGVGMLSQMVGVCWLLRKCQTDFQDGSVIFHFCLQHEEFQLLHILRNTWNYHLLLLLFLI